MSLQLAAQHLSNQGRGPDDTLVHMSRDEVKSLNDLAMAHGGQLTINPHTGLPEAGFLSSLLPMVAGAALTGLSGGAINPLTASLLVGGGTMLMGGSLQKGLMAGLGAYGGGGLGQGLADLGVSSESGLTGGATGGANVPNTTALENAKLAEQANQAKQLADAKAAADIGAPGVFGGTPPPSPTPGGNIGADFEQMPGNMPQGNLVSNPLTGSQLPPQPGITDRLGNMGNGISQVFNDPSKLKDVGGGSWTGLAKMGLAAAAPAIAKTSSLNMPTTQQKAQVVPHYRYTPGMATPTPVASPTGVENTYFPGSKYTALSDAEAQQLYPGYPDYAKPATAANGGVMGYAGGGPVEQMSNANAIGANTGFPQAYLHNAAYATPYQTPISQNVLTGPGDTAVDPYTGEQKMAAGGPARTDTPYAAGYSGYAGNNTSNSPGTNNGSPTGSAVGDAAYAISNQNISPIAAMIAEAMMEANSSTSPTSANATNGMDVASDAATAAGAGTSAGVGGPAGEGSTGMGSDTGGDGGGGDGEARGGLSPYFKHHMATGGLSDAHYNLGGYSDGGRLLRGPGDGVSDSIPAVIGKKQPARLADGEFVVPARIVSELGNGSTEAGARKLYAMMDRIQASRKNTVGKGKVAKNNRADKYLPA